MPKPIVLDLPLPPSVNHIWRQGRDRNTGERVFHKSKKYAQWLKEARDQLILQKVGKGWHTLMDGFCVTLTLCRKKLRKNADMDNRIKPILDFSQDVGLVDNDKHCQRIVIEFGHAPLGARVTLEPHEMS